MSVFSFTFLVMESLIFFYGLNRHIANFITIYVLLHGGLNFVFKNVTSFLVFSIQYVL